MHPTRSYIVAALLLLLTNACDHDPADDPIIGSWRAYSVEEEGRELAVDLNDIRLRFDETGTYHFHGTLNQTEAGPFRRRKDILITQDTLHSGSGPRTVQISLLAADTLVLLMQEAGKKRTLSLQREF